MNRETSSIAQLNFQGYQGSGSPEICAPGASYAVAFLSSLEKSSAPDAYGVSPRLGFPVKMIEAKNPDQDNTSTDRTPKEHSQYPDTDQFR